MHRLEAVAHVRQRAADDDAHGVVEVRRLAAPPRWGPSGRSRLGRSCATPRGAVTLVGGRVMGFDERREPRRSGSRRCRSMGPRRSRRRPARRARSSVGAARRAGADERVADDPGAGAVGASRTAMSVSRPRKPADGLRVEARPVAEGPRERLLDHLLGIAHEHRQEVHRAAAQPIPELSPAGRRHAMGQRGQRGPHEPSFERPRRVDELLELRPAERLREDRHGPHLREAVDLDPVLSARCHAAQRAARTARVLRQRAPQARQREEPQVAVARSAARRWASVEGAAAGTVPQRSAHRSLPRPRRSGPRTA